MTDRPTDRSVSIEDTCLSRVDRDDNPLQEPAPKTYQSQDRYRRNKTKPNTEQTTASAEESMNPKGLNRAVGRENEISSAYPSFTSSFNHPQTQTSDAHSANLQTPPRSDTRQLESAIALPQHVPWLAAHPPSPHATYQQEDRGLDTTPGLSNTHQQSSSEMTTVFSTHADSKGSSNKTTQSSREDGNRDTQSRLDGFNISPSRSISDEKEPNIHLNVKSLNYSHPQSFLEDPQSSQQPQLPGRNPNRHFNVHMSSPFVSGQQSSSLTPSHSHFKTPSSFLHEPHSSGLTPPLRSIQNSRSFYHESQSPGFLPNLRNILGNQQNDCSDTRSHQGGGFQMGGHFDGYSQPARPSNAGQSNSKEADSPLQYKSQPTNRSDEQLSSFQTRNDARTMEYPRFGTNRFANLQDVKADHGQDSPASSHRSTQSGYKPAHLRYGQAPHRESSQTSKAGDASVLTTPRYPLEFGQSYEATGPRDFSALLATPKNPLKHGYGYEAPEESKYSDLEYRQQRSQSARGFYSPAPYTDRPLPSLPQKSRQMEEILQLDQAMREAQEELMLEDKNHEKICDKRGDHVRELRASRLKKAKSGFFPNELEAPATGYQPRSFTPDVNLQRRPPQIPPPTPRPTTGYNHLINHVSAGSGVDCLSGISEIGTATSSIMREFIAQNKVERFIRSFSRSSAQGILAGLKNLDNKIDWLGDSLWKGSEDARKLFANQHNETIKLIYYRVSSSCSSCMTPC